MSSQAGGPVTTDEFVKLSEKLTGMQLDDLFETWLFTPSKPEGIAPAADALRAAGLRTAPVVDASPRFSKR